MDSLNVGGDTITNDISLVLDITKDEAEKIKMQYPLAMRRYIENPNLCLQNICTNMLKRLSVTAFSY
ncbi:MAG: cell division FtsA domain-containing protein, partial [Acidaminococcaceae bacterium]|nr:cell division FtsA domain-containing protein [Acidaminococcaceae bacterium]